MRKDSRFRYYKCIGQLPRQPLLMEIQVRSSYVSKYSKGYNYIQSFLYFIPLFLCNNGRDIYADEVPFCSVRQFIRNLQWSSHRCHWLLFGCREKLIIDIISRLTTNKPILLLRWCDPEVRIEETFFLPLFYKRRDFTNSFTCFLLLISSHFLRIFDL